MGFSYVHQTRSNHGRAPGIQDPTKWLLHWDKLTKPNDRTNIFTIPIQTQVKKYYVSINLQPYRLAQTANVVKEHHLQAEPGETFNPTDKQKFLTSIRIMWKSGRA